MASEEQEAAVSFALPAEVDDWLGEQARRRDESRGEVCRQLVTAAHALTTDDEYAVPADRAAVEELRTQLDARHEEFVDLLEDVRDRVIQVKRETDAKAPADHDHDAYAEATALDRVESALTELEGELADLAERTDEGFENVEAVLDHLLAETETLSGRSATLAEAVLALRNRRDARATQERRRAEAEAIKLAANRSNVRTANCGACGTSVDVALLTRPECPHCAATIADVERRHSLLGSHTLVIGEPPALPGRVEDEAVDRERLEAAVAEAADGESGAADGADGESGAADGADGESGAVDGADADGPAVGVANVEDQEADDE